MPAVAESDSQLLETGIPGVQFVGGIALKHMRAIRSSKANSGSVAQKQAVRKQPEPKLDLSPRVIVERVLEETRPVSFVGLRMVEPLALEKTAEWVADFNAEFYRLARERQLNAAAPSVVVFAPALAFAERCRLHDAGAILFMDDEAGPSDSESLKEWLNQHLGLASAIPRPAVEERPERPSELNAANQLPPGMSADSLAELVRFLNQRGM